MRCVAALGPPGFGRMLVDTMCFRRRCVCASCNRDCRLSTLARASDARATAPTRSRAPARAFAVTRPHFILGCVPPFHFTYRFARQLPESVPSHPYATSNSFCLATYSAVLTSSIGYVNLFLEGLSRSPFTRFPRSPPGIIPHAVNHGDSSLFSIVPCGESILNCVPVPISAAAARYIHRLPCRLHARNTPNYLEAGLSR
jgi:hypothetical protein